MYWPNTAVSIIFLVLLINVYFGRTIGWYVLSQAWLGWWPLNLLQSRNQYGEYIWVELWVLRRSIKTEISRIFTFDFREKSIFWEAVTNLFWKKTTLKQSAAAPPVLINLTSFSDKRLLVYSEYWPWRPYFDNILSFIVLCFRHAKCSWGVVRLAF